MRYHHARATWRWCGVYLVSSRRSKKMGDIVIGKSRWRLVPLFFLTVFKRCGHNYWRALKRFKKRGHKREKKKNLSLKLNEFTRVFEKRGGENTFFVFGSASPPIVFGRRVSIFLGAEQRWGIASHISVKENQIKEMVKGVQRCRQPSVKTKATVSVENFFLTMPRTRLRYSSSFPRFLNLLALTLVILFPPY